MSSELPHEKISAAGWLAWVKTSERVGDYIQAYDIANKGLADYPDDLALKHRAVLCLARSGGLERATTEFAERGLAEAAAEGEHADADSEP